MVTYSVPSWFHCISYVRINGEGSWPGLEPVNLRARGTFLGMCHLFCDAAVWWGDSNSAFYDEKIFGVSTENNTTEIYATGSALCSIFLRTHKKRFRIAQFLEQLIEMRALKHRQLHAPVYRNMMKYVWYAPTLITSREIFWNVSHIAFQDEVEAAECWIQPERIRLMFLVFQILVFSLHLR
jgi:hypothetical protein